jgi:NitT/TauT family transport system substrate-binding protein
VFSLSSRAKKAGAVAGALGVLALSACSSSTQLETGDGGLTKVVYTQSTPTLSFAPVLVARDQGFFAEEGIDLEFSTQESGSVATQALLSDSVQFAGLASTDIASAVSGGAQLTAIQSMMNMTMELCVSQDFMARTGVTPSSPIADRLAALRGENVGITAAGSASDRGLRWLLSEVGGLTPDQDVTVTGVNGASAMNAALQSGQIAGYLLSPPFCETAAKQGFGAVLVTPDEVDQFSRVVLQIVVAQNSFLEANPQVAESFARAMTKGNDYLRDHTAESVAILQKEFPQTDPAIVESAVEDVIAPQVPAGGRFTADGWAATKEILIGSGGRAADLDTSEGGFWTNRYLGDA